MTTPVPARWPRPDAQGRFLEKHLPTYLSRAALDAKADKMVVNAADFPIAGDGVTDDTAALQAAVGATPDGGTLFIPPRTYYITGSITNVQKSMTIWMYGAKFINGEAGSPFSFSGGFETIYPVSEMSTVTIAETENSGPGLRLVLPSDPGWKKGDPVKLVADDVIPGGRPENGETQRRVGMNLLVQSCVGNEVVLMGELDDPMTTNIRVARYRDVRLQVFGGTIDTLEGRTVPPAAVTLASSAISDNLLTLSAPRPEIYTAAPVVFSGTGLPTGITAGTEYYAIPVSATTMRIASSKPNARAGTALAVSGTPGSVTALFRSWGGSMMAFTALRNFVLRDVVSVDAPSQAFSFNGCFGGNVDNIEVRHCYDNIHTGAFGYGINVNASSDVTITNYRAGRTRHAYTDDTNRSGAGDTALYRYGRTRNCGVRGGGSSNSSNTAWDTHHTGIYGFFEDVYAEDCNVGLSFRGRKHRARNVYVKNVRLAVRAFCETAGGESWGHDIDGVYGEALSAFTFSANNGGEFAGVRETRLNTIRNVHVKGLTRYACAVINSTVAMENITVEYAEKVDSDTRVFDFNNSDVRTAKNIEIDFRKNTTGTGLRLVREQKSAGYFKFDGLRVHSGLDLSTRANRVFETPTDMVFEARNVILDYSPIGIVGGTPTDTIIEYKVVKGPADSSEYIAAADTAISGGVAARELRKTSLSPVVFDLSPSVETKMGAMYDAKLRGQVVHIRNSGTANLIVPSSSGAKMTMIGGAEKTLAPGESVTVVYIPGSNWCELTAGAGSRPWAAQALMNSEAMVDGFNDLGGGLMVDCDITLESVRFWLEDPAATVTGPAGSAATIEWWAGSVTNRQEKLIHTSTLAAGQNYLSQSLSPGQDYPADTVLRPKVLLDGTTIDVPCHVQFRGRERSR